MSDLNSRNEPSLMPRTGENVSPPKRTGKSVDIFCVSRDASMLTIADRIGERLPFARITKRAISNGHADPLYGLENLPDLVIFFQGSEWTKELEEYAKRPADLRPPLLVIGNVDNPASLRAAMKAGAKDFLAETADVAEMVQVLRSVLGEIMTNRREGHGNLVAVINAKGGSGASLLASNIAYLSAVALEQRTVFVDLDIQFGSAGQYLETPPRRGLLEALQLIDELDEMALDGYVVKHKSGLGLLSAEGCNLLLEEELTEYHLGKLLDLLTSSYEQVIVDIPRHIDPFAIALLERADRIAVVVQQSIATIRDATRLLHILRTDLGVDSSRVQVVVNRFQNDAEISLKDIEHTLGWPSLIAVPNDFRTVKECLDKVVPICELGRGKPINRAVQTLSEAMTGIALPAKPGVLARIRSWF